MLDLWLKNIKTCYTPHHTPPIHGAKMRDILMLYDCHIGIEGKNIVWFSTAEPTQVDAHTIIVDCHDKIVLPGIIDMHTHLVHYGSREDETMKLLNGESYLDILKEGGGILKSVRMTREASFEQLLEKSIKHLDVMLLHGVTTIEAKSGYGLDEETELKQLRVSKALNEIHPIHIVSTYLGAHAIPQEYKHDVPAYIDLMKSLYPKIKQEKLATAIDVFFESHVYDYKQTKQIIEDAKEFGFDIHLHADEITSLNGAELAVKMKAKSADHLMAVSDKDIDILANSETIANVLPMTSFFLNKSFAPVRKMIDWGCAVALSSDFNPGSQPSENIHFGMHLALTRMHMKPCEILTAVTLQSAYALGVSNRVGSIEVGKQADLIVINERNLESYLIHYGVNSVDTVISNGVIVVQNGRRL